jgi:hypothetical protein
MPHRYDLDSYRASHADLEQRHGAFLAGINQLRDQLLARLLQIVEIGGARPNEEIAPGTFLHTFLWLASKVFSHAESIRALVAIGRYGDASMLIRGLLGDVTMLQYISSHPDSCLELVELSMLREPTPKKGTRFAKLKAKYSEPNLRRAIEKAGDRPWSREIYGIYSDPAHPSLWGMQFYGRRQLGTAADFSITCAPLFEQIAAFRCIGYCSALLFDAIITFFVWRQRSGIPWGEDLEGTWLAECDDTLKELASASAYLARNHKKLYPRDVPRAE